MWGFVLKLTVGDGLVLLHSKTLYDTIGVTSTDLGLQIQAERALTVGVLSTGQTGSAALTDQQAKTSAAAEKFKRAATDDATREAAGDDLRVPLDTMIASVDRLPSIREGVTLGKSSRLQAITAYDGLMDDMFALYERLVSVPDLAIFQQASAMQGMGNAYEMIAREDALVRGALASGRMSQDEQNAFSEWVSTRRFLYAKNRPVLTGAMREPYEQVLTSPLFDRFAGLEDRIVNQVRAGGPLPQDSDKWASTVDSLGMRLDAARVKASDALTANATSVAGGIMARIGVAGGLGLVVIIITIVFSVRFGRRLARDLAGLRDAALDLADVRLPQVVDKLRRGEEVDVEAEAPPIQAGGSNEIEDVAHAFSSVQRTAVEAAVGQANLRRGVNQVFLNLARRKQSLLHRQLTLLDSMQRRADDPESLEDLFRLDHLTTRMRRHAEGLIILSGANPGRSWRKPVPLIDVVRAAISEVEDYTRITMMPMPDTSISGTAVADIVHLVAELLENATIFSPPQTKVQVRGEVVANGIVLEIEDRGLGLSPEEYAEVNARLADPPEFDLADSDRLGLFVVSQLASRYEIRVVLRSSPYGGTTAIVLVPRALMAGDGSPAAINGSAVRTGAHAKPALAAGEDDPAGTAAAWGAARQGDAPVLNGSLFTDRGPVGPRRTDAYAGPVDAEAAEAGPAAYAGSPNGSADLGRNGAADEAPAPDHADDDGDGPESSPFFTPAALRTEAVPSAIRDDLESEPAVGEPAEATHRVSPARDVPRLRPIPAEPAGDGPFEAPERGGVPRPRVSAPKGMHAGLPRRVRQASMAPQLRDQPLQAPVPPPAPEERSPEEARAMFSAFQRGALRGREDSEQPPGGATGDHVQTRHGEKGEE
ncbi:nitrate- and nitrite sensing domain-containing protein [Microbispora corallina]|uniref:histidine kinase n=1 Tax=Microbispora corallina TaxID=83302 RepID=A0ABQ4G2E9_9ACTN|nr:histidine kinase [Microbispora corallina]